MHMLQLCASEALLYACCKLLCVSIKCRHALVFTRKTNIRWALFWTKRQLQQTWSKASDARKCNIWMLIRVNWGLYNTDCVQSCHLWPWIKVWRWVRHCSMLFMPLQSLAGQVRPMQTQCRSDSESRFWANCMWYYQNHKPVNVCTEITFITGAIPLSAKGSANYE